MALPRALAPAPSRVPARPPSPRALVPARALPVVARAATATLAGLAIEHLVRIAANRALESFRPARDGRTVTAVVTEITVVERFRRD